MVDLHVYPRKLPKQLMGSEIKLCLTNCILLLRNDSLLNNSISLIMFNNDPCIQYAASFLISKFIFTTSNIFEKSE